MLQVAKTALIEFKAPKVDKVTAIIDAPGITVDSASYGGWEAIERPNAKPLTTRPRMPGLVITVPILFDELRSGDGDEIERRCHRLELMAGRSTDDAIVTIKTVSTDRQALIPRSQSLTYVITGLEWGDSIRSTANGHRLRQAGTVTLMEHIAPTVTIEKSASRRAGNSKRPSTHIVKKGESLQDISILRYGTSDRWKDIKQANGIHETRLLPKRPKKDAKHRLYVGRKLTLPK